MTARRGVVIVHAAGNGSTERGVGIVNATMRNLDHLTEGRGIGKERGTENGSENTAVVAGTEGSRSGNVLHPLLSYIYANGFNVV